jgi:hypothetical protein
MCTKLRTHKLFLQFIYYCKLIQLLYFGGVEKSVILDLSAACVINLKTLHSNVSFLHKHCAIQTAAEPCLKYSAILQYSKPTVTI